ncbi:MAG: hypothetical protein F4X02_04410 [Chloroflexi bacterium]|nr:hypothetical protein [Chloroflexota bacterium]
MAESNGNHERRISTIEGEMKSVATKADLAELKHDLMQSFQSAIKDQTTELQASLDKQQASLDKQSDQIGDLQTKESRLRGIGDTLRVIAPFVVSIVAVVVALASR